MSVDEREEIRELYREYWRCMIAKDADGLRDILAAVYGGRKSSWRLRGDFTLRREDGVWRFTCSRASTY